MRTGPRTIVLGHPERLCTLLLLSIGGWGAAGYTLQRLTRLPVHWPFLLLKPITRTAFPLVNSTAILHARLCEAVDARALMRGDAVEQISSLGAAKVHAAAHCLRWLLSHHETMRARRVAFAHAHEFKRAGKVCEHIDAGHCICLCTCHDRSNDARSDPPANAQELRTLERINANSNGTCISTTCDGDVWVCSL